MCASSQGHQQQRAEMTNQLVTVADKGQSACYSEMVMKGQEQVFPHFPKEDRKSNCQRGRHTQALLDGYKNEDFEPALILHLRTPQGITTRPMCWLMGLDHHRDGVDREANPHWSLLKP